MKVNLQPLIWVGAGWLVSISTATAAPMGSGISYQGVLEDAGVSVTGQVDMIFTLHDAATLGNVVGTAVIFDGQVGNGLPVDVTEGLFTAAPDFGANVFDGTALWLAIQVRNPHDATDTAMYTPLDPRQPITAVPVALQTRGIFVSENNSNVGIGLTTPQFPLQVHLGPGTGTVPANGTAIHGNSASGYGVVGFSKGAARAGVWGENNATSGEARGVWGRSTFSTGIGVYAEGFSFAGANHALHAKTNSPDGYAGYFEGGKNYFEGDVGIGTMSPAVGFKLDVAGSIRCVSLTQTSSRSLKENITPIEGALEKVSRLQGIRFRWTKNLGGQPDLGFVAEDVAKVFPELVTWEEEGITASGLKYGHLTAVAIEAIKELNAEAKEKDERIADLTARLERLEALIGAGHGGTR